MLWLDDFLYKKSKVYIAEADNQRSGSAGLLRCRFFFAVRQYRPCHGSIEGILRITACCGQLWRVQVEDYRSSEMKGCRI
ncbi:hypothetical protein [Desulfovibrio sp.]|uniref:hypothetical protein n=1 Tax=Desulfovibrio TaxID=872 RepID=UPI0025B8969F|nr:hypothetical protein [Desulfovibrio sp.]